MGSRLGHVVAVQHIRAMRGGSQPHLMRASDGGLYVVKFQNNPQHSRVLANELIATRLAHYIELPVPTPTIIHVPEYLIRENPQLRIELPGQAVLCSAGLHFASWFVGQIPTVRICEAFPDTVLNRVHQLEVFAGALVLDKWLCNVDGRQVIFWRKGVYRRYRVSFIDQGYCLGAGEWNFRDSPIQGVYYTDEVYLGVTGWDYFEPWLSHAEHISEEVVWHVVSSVPEEWYGADRVGMVRLAEQIYKRRSNIRALLLSFANSSRNPFPHWPISRRQ